MSAIQQALLMGGGGGGGDPFFANVSLLLHMDGSNGSTSFPDNSPSPKTVSSVGATVSTSVVKYGTGSGYFDGNSELQLPASNDFILDGNFTIECWLYQSTTSIRVVLGSNYSSTNNQIQFNQSGPTTGLYNGSQWQTLALLSSPVNTWIFMVYQRQGSTITIYQDGISLGTINSASIYNFSNGAIGALRGVTSERWLGYVDDLRITKGVARYTSNFTPPTAPYPNS